ncbi:hypothetical protein SPRG_06203 [Saprolegnia parasitica CBS 223.65]|uniref:Uncharacterized protein n=1 Tax=Saprolegnia parasitica (strain CBS 223.65) TaxID=695850 RepID=A0A067CNQ6_SAPPC|nr:hypothetical protein SPRG_06203 [Saprolegnia parasitica CBS 223.65]KDO28156.1 hypothetical protein SPRG_06203 [Saprolegnia parasitica CBS 223.65]|eukprot:XP_012200983.1 hypothetical protein SPRG_06203 [Saprolegnia parasitica CBS 223.65]
MTAPLLLLVALGSLLLPASTRATTAACDVCQYKSYACGSALADRSVCTADGRVQMDDVFCDADCICADGFVCANLRLGHHVLAAGHARPRCVSADGLRVRFESCRHVSPTAPPVGAYNLSAWLRFHDAACTTQDCRATRAVERLHQSGRVIVLWTEAPSTYHFITEGTLTNLSSGIFHSVAQWDEVRDRLIGVQSHGIDKCYTLQTRNTNNAKCKGYILSAEHATDTALWTTDLPPSIWAAVVASVLAAFGSVVAVVYVGCHASRAVYAPRSRPMAPTAEPTHRE